MYTSSNSSKISPGSITKEYTNEKMLFEILQVVGHQMTESGLTELPTELIAVTLGYVLLLTFHFILYRW